MSDAYAQVFTPQGELVGYTVYHGSSSGIWPPKLSAEFTWEGRHDFWAQGEDPDHDCWSRAEVCVVSHNYGGGSFWAGLYCPDCYELLGPFSEWNPEAEIKLDAEDPEYFDGHPFPELDRADLIGKPTE